MNRAERRANGQTNKQPVRIAGEVEWSTGKNAGHTTTEAFASFRAIQRVSGGRTRSR